jgi:hypothetical protein
LVAGFLGVWRWGLDIALVLPGNSTKPGRGMIEWPHGDAGLGLAA